LSGIEIFTDPYRSIVTIRFNANAANLGHTRSWDPEEQKNAYGRSFVCCLFRDQQLYPLNPSNPYGKAVNPFKLFPKPLDKTKPSRYHFHTMNEKHPKKALVLIAILILLVLGFLWYRQGLPGSGRSESFSPVVDRGFMTPEDEQYAQSLIEKAERELAESEERDLTLILIAGNAHFTYGNLAEAIRYYDDILSTHPSDAPALENKGQALYDGGDYKGAKEAWHSALLSDPRENTYLRLARLYTNELSEESDRTLPLLEEAIATRGQTVPLMLSLANWYRDNNQYEEAISHYKIVLQLDPENSDVAEQIQVLQAELTKQFQEANK
jgi:tetratricopeptide (TPR) repeat protein